MTIVLDKKTPIKKAKAQINALQKKKQFDPYQFLGKIKKWGKSGVEYQKMVRDEWQNLSRYEYTCRIVKWK